MDKYGIPFKPPYIRHWGARAIFTANKGIDLLHDRQSYEGSQEDSQPFTSWLDNQALPWLRQEVKRINLSSSDPQVIKFSKFNYELRACTNESCGYLYIGAVEHPQIPGPSHRNTATNEEEKVVIVNGVSYVVDNQLVPVGTKGKILTNGIGPATVVGYEEENYGPGKLVLLHVLPHNPPKWMITQMMQEDAQILVDQGRLPKAKNCLEPFPATRSKAYIEWKKNWKMRPVSIWASGFQADTI